MNDFDTFETDVPVMFEHQRILDLYYDEIKVMNNAKTKAELLGEKFVDMLKHSEVASPWFRCAQLEELEQYVRLKKKDAKTEFICSAMLDLIFGTDGFWKKHKVEITKLVFYGYDRHGCDINITAHGEEYVLYVPIYENAKAMPEEISNGLLSARAFQYRCLMKDKIKSKKHFTVHEFVDGKNDYASFDYKIPCNAIRAAIESSAKAKFCSRNMAALAKESCEEAVDDK